MRTPLSEIAVQLAPNSNVGPGAIVVDPRPIVMFLGLRYSDDTNGKWLGKRYAHWAQYQLGGTEISLANDTQVEVFKQLVDKEFLVN
jgi:hypothetical protein